MNFPVVFWNILEWGKYTLKGTLWSERPDFTGRFYLQKFCVTRHQFGIIVCFFSFSIDMAGWKASKYYQNAARKVAGQHLWILLIFEALPKRTRLWTESVTVKCERITMNQAVQGIFPDCTGIQTRPLELRVTRRLDRRCKDGDSTDEQRGKWFMSYFI